MNNIMSPQSPTMDVDDTNDGLKLSLPKNRFALELEFVQSLSSPRYLHHLANEHYFRDETFIKWLR
jgi:hypothetical protein